MKEEYLDIVNEKDEVIGRETREKIHALNLCHREALAFLFGSDDRILIQKRSLKKSVDPGIWGIAVAGHVEAGKSYKETAKREAKEELGVDIKNVKLIVIKKPSAEDEENRFFGIFLGKTDGPFKIDPEEVEEIKFLTLEELEDCFLKESNIFDKRFVEFYRKNKQGLIDKIKI